MPLGVRTTPGSAATSAGMTGAGLSTQATPAATAAATAATTTGPGISVLTTTQPAPASSRGARAAVTWPTGRAPLAPGPRAIWFSPRSSTTIRATPVGLVGQYRHPRAVDPLGPQLVEGADSVGVGPHRRHQRHGGPGPGRRHRGVGPLAAAERLQPTARHRLTRRRQPGRHHHQIDVDGADHDHAGLHPAPHGREAQARAGRRELRAPVDQSVTKR